MESNNIDKKETIFTTPTVCGCYSITGRNYIFSADASRLRYWNKYCPQQGSVEINLNDRPRDHIGRDPKNHPKLLNNLLKYIMADKKRFTDVLKDDAIALQESPVVCSRRCLKVISSLPYFLKDPNTIHCCLYRGVIYFYDLPKSEDRAPDDAGANWGHKFEQYMLAGKPNKPYIKNCKLNLTIFRFAGFPS